MNIRHTVRSFALSPLLCAALTAQTTFFTFDAVVVSSSPTQIDYAVGVGSLQGNAINPFLRAFGGPFELCAYHVADVAGNDVSRFTAGHFTRVPLRTGVGSFSIPLHDGLTYCYLSLEAFPAFWGISGVHEGGARVPLLGANAPSRVGVVGGAYTHIDNEAAVHNLVNSVIVPLPKPLALEVMNGQKSLVLRDPATGLTRYMQTAPWTHWLETDNGRRIVREVVAWFHNKKYGATGPYYEQLELHAVPAAHVDPPQFSLQSELPRPARIRLEVKPARGSGLYLFEADFWSPQEVLVDGPLVKVLRYRGALRPTGQIDNPVPAEHCPIVNLVVEVYSGETFLNVKALLTNSRFEGTGDFIFDEIRLAIPGAYIRTHNYSPIEQPYELYRQDRSGHGSIALVPSIGGGLNNRLRENGSFLWNTGIFAEFGRPGGRVERAADNLRVYLTQFFGDRNLGANYFDQPFIRGAGIPDLRYQDMMEDWKTSWQRPTGINDNARRVFTLYVPRNKLYRSEGSSPHLFPYPCFGPYTGSETGVDEVVMPRNGAVVLAYNANSVYINEAIETALFMGRGAMTRQPMDTLFLADGRANTLDHMRYRMWDAPSNERIPEARMIGGQYLYNSGNNTRSLFHPNLDYKRTAAYQAHVANANVPYRELLAPHDTEHSQRFVTHVMESMFKMNPDYLAKIYMDAACEALCSLSHYTGESTARSYTHIPYGTSLWGLLTSNPGSGTGGRFFEAFGLQSEAMFHRPLRQSDVIIGRQLAAIVRHVARGNGYMGCIYGPDARHFNAQQEAGLRDQVSQHLTQLLQRPVGQDDFDLASVDIRWQADVWNMIVGGVAKAYENSALDAEARTVLQAIDRELVASYTEQFDGAFSTYHDTRIHLGLEFVRYQGVAYRVPNSIKNGPHANMSGGPYERWALGLYNELPMLRAHLDNTDRLDSDFRGNNRNLMLPVSSVGQESVNGAGIQTMWAFQKMGR